MLRKEKQRMKEPKGRIRTSWLAISVSALLFICLLFFIFSFSVNRSLEKNEEESLNATAQSFRTLMDDSLNNLLNQSLSLLRSNAAVDLQRLTTQEELKAGGIYDLFLEIRNILDFSDLLEDLTIYFPASGYVVGRNGVRPLRTYCAGLAASGIAGIEERMELYQEQEGGYFVLSDGCRCELYYRIRLGTDACRVMLLKVSAEAVSDRLAWIQGDAGQGFAAVCDKQGAVMACCGNTEKFLTEEGSLQLPKGKNWIISTLPSEAEGLNYIMITGKNETYHLSALYMILSILLLALTVLAGGFMVYWLYRRSVQPLEQIAGRLSRVSEAGSNEVQLINEAIEDLLTELDTVTGRLTEERILREKAEKAAETQAAREAAEKPEAGENGDSIEDPAAIHEISGKLYHLIEEEYTSQDLDVSYLAEKLGYSQAYLSRLFKNDYGMGIAEYITGVRIQKAKELLEDPAVSIREIAARVGFAGDVQFIRAFKRLEQVTPGAYRSRLFGE